jgi:hypothetical protein
MAITVNTELFKVGKFMGCIQEVTGDGSIRTWDTGLGKVLFYIGVGNAGEAHGIVTGWYYNYSDGGTTARAGGVYAPWAIDNGVTCTFLGIGMP